MWDSWVFPWNGKFHLFFLETQQSKFDHIGRAVSDDLLRWYPLPSIPMKGSEGEWNHYGALTGTVIRHDGRFYLLVGSIPGDDEAVGLWVSDDLEYWRADAANPVFKSAGPHYLNGRAEAPYWPVDWRDPSVIWQPDDQHYHAVLCARRPRWNADDTGAVLAHVRSKDLRRWEYLPPLASLERFFHTEVPDWFELNGRWYLTFNTLSLGGIQIHTPCRESVTGAFYMMADDANGPYRLPSDPFLVGAGGGRQSAYSARTVPYGDGRLLYAHLNGRRPAWGTPKLLRSDRDGHLWPAWLPALEKLETQVICGSVQDVAASPSDALGHWKHEGERIIGSARVIGASQRIASDVGDLNLCCQIRAVSAARAGVVLRGDPAGSGIAVLLDYEQQRIQIGCVNGRDIIKNSIGPFASWNFKAFDTCRWELDRNRQYSLRCLARDEYFEVYLDDRWVFTASPSLPPAVCEVPGRGCVDLYVERGEAAFGELRLAALALLED